MLNNDNDNYKSEKKEPALNSKPQNSGNMSMTIHTWLTPTHSTNPMWDLDLAYCKWNQTRNSINQVRRHS